MLKVVIDGQAMFDLTGLMTLFNRLRAFESPRALTRPESSEGVAA